MARVPRSTPTVRRRLFVAMCGGLLGLLVVVGPAAACAPEVPPPDPDALVRDAVLIVLGDASDTPVGKPIRNLAVTKTLLGPSRTDVDLTKVVDDTCPFTAVAPGPGVPGVWVFTDLSSISTSNAGVWPIDEAGAILDGWPPGRPLGATTVDRFTVLLSTPATDAQVPPDKAPASPAWWPAAAITALAGWLIASAVLRRRAAR